MNPLYIVELDVSIADGSDLCASSIYDRLLEHAATWLSRDSEDSFPSLYESGTVELPAHRGAFEFTRSVRWTATEVNKVRAISCTMRQPIEGAVGAQFICDFTIFQNDEKAVLRVELGRETIEGLMSPIPIQFVRRPGLISLAVSDSDLHFSYQGQQIDERFEWINPMHATLVPEVLGSKKRLPILLIDGGYERAVKVGRAAARQLMGLVRVVIIDRPSQLKNIDYLRNIQARVPEDGARLIWPILQARHPDFQDMDRSENFIDILMKIVGPVSASARGTNRWRVIAAEEKRREQEIMFKNAIKQVQAEGDQDAELKFLRRRVSEQNSEIAQWIFEVEELSKTNDSNIALQHELAYWKSEAQRAYRNAVDKGIELSWESCPDLNATDLTGLSSYLEKISGGAIKFTQSAARSWSKSEYPHVKTMREALVALARAAVTWKKLDRQIGENMKDWLKKEFELNYSPEDEPLKRKNLNMFEYEEKLYSRESHLKLNDHVKPNEVGRVYFSIDSDGLRFIVDHVGLKLYGV